MITFFIIALGLCLMPGLLLADYTLVLKNGRRITAPSYREEGSMVKIPGLGGEFGIPKNQIQTILKAGASERGLSITDLEASSRRGEVPVQKSAETLPQDVTGLPSSKETKPLVNAEEEIEYQKRLAEVTKKLEAAKQEYFDATQGGGSASNLSKEGWSGWIADLGSRIRDSQKVPGGGGPASTPPMPSSAPAYTPREKKISDLRIQIDTLQKERDDLVAEMKSKNIPTGTP